jgi:DNA recombination protein RmuC
MQVLQENLPLFLFILIGFVAVLLLIRHWISQAIEGIKPSQELIEWLRSTNARMDDQGKQIVSTLNLSTKSLNERLDKAAQYIGAVQKNIGEMSEIGRSMKELQDMLKSPKLRGNISEQVLRDILSQMFPKQAFHLQYAFKSGSIVDAAIVTGQGIIPVDAKFPMENFRKMMSLKTDEERNTARKTFASDVKKHIDDISRKYILTEEGTIDYALMYIPSEAVYYEVVNEPTLFDYAGDKRVLPVSPMTFYAYMKTILMSLEGQKIESQAKRILIAIRAVQREYGKVDENLGVLNRHMTNAYNQLSTLRDSYASLGQKLTSVQQLETGENK